MRRAERFDLEKRWWDTVLVQRVVVRVEVHRCRSDIAPAPGLPRWWPPGDAVLQPLSMRDPETVVREFCAAWNGRDVDAILAWFAADAVYHNMPIAPVRGHAETRGVLEIFVPPSRRSSRLDLAPRPPCIPGPSLQVANSANPTS
jgi:hypothetical protein